MVVTILRPQCIPGFLELVGGAFAQTYNYELEYHSRNHGCSLTILYLALTKAPLHPLYELPHTPMKEGTADPQRQNPKPKGPRRGLNNQDIHIVGPPFEACIGDVKGLYKISVQLPEYGYVVNKRVIVQTPYLPARLAGSS